MNTSVIEASYPISFREEDARTLGGHLQQQQSAALVGMKRVGISNFLRFFLYHPDIVTAYISQNDKHLFIPIDLNDLVERELFPFWTLTLKRIVDCVQASSLPETVKKDIDHLFVESIQSQDLFFVSDSVRHALVSIVEKEIQPTLFFLRFDRMKDAVNPAFFDNLQGLRDATHQKLTYVFTSFRSLDVLAPAVFSKASLAAFLQNHYLRPASHNDMQIIAASYKSRAKLVLPKDIEKKLFEMVNGYIQYLQLALIILSEQRREQGEVTEEMLTLIPKDERIMLQSEELWESLTTDEKEVLLKVFHGESISESEKKRAAYLWATGFVVDTDKVQQIFSTLFVQYLKQRQEKAAKEKDVVHFSKKEHLLFTFLKLHENSICERDSIVNAVWPEYTELGVSDWAIDRLVARVRAKLRQQGSSLEIKTIRTRGYQLTTLS